MNDAQQTELSDARGTNAAPPMGAMQERAQFGIGQITGAAKDAIGDLAASGATDQLRGYANEAVGRAKMALGLAARSPELTVAGLAQIAVGGVQRAIGEAQAEDEAAAGSESVDAPAGASTADEAERAVSDRA